MLEIEFARVPPNAIGSRKLFGYDGTEVWVATRTHDGEVTFVRWIAPPGIRQPGEWQEELPDGVASWHPNWQPGWPAP
jgi:hypothetical protein